MLPFLAFIRVKSWGRYGPIGPRMQSMAFTKLSIGTGGPGSVSKTMSEPETDIWAVFRALRDARKQFGLRPAHLQTLQAMLSFLRPGQGDTVFASNQSICQRVGGIDERTLRRHINRFVETKLIERNDSSNRKRYRVRSSDGECISYGLSLAPLLQRAPELISLAKKIEEARRDQIFLRKQILTGLAHLDSVDPNNTFAIATRKVLRRKLSVTEYRAVLNQTKAECSSQPRPMKAPKTTKVTVNDGQTVRHLSKSIKEQKDLENQTSEKGISPSQLTAVCDQATSFSNRELKNWSEIECLAHTLAPMMGIHKETFNKAKATVGSIRASCAIFIMLQLRNSIRDFSAYFHSLTLGNRRDQFDPAVLLRRLSKTDRAMT